MTNLTSLTDRRAARRGEHDTETLVTAAAAGEPLAWSQLIDRYTVLVRSVCRAHRLCDADADDVAQLTWLRAVEHIGRLRDPERFGAWIGTTARHECLAVLRGRRRVVPTDDEIQQPLFAGHVDASETELAAERREVVRHALGTLPPRQQTLLRLLHSDSAPSYEAIGLALDMPVGSIGPTRGRALERLRRELQHGYRSAA
ncbi:MAG: sigma-70 family RNA polymerase sigma factor [Solirubrobacteraceae bacterium]